MTRSAGTALPFRRFASWRSDEVVDRHIMGECGRAIKWRWSVFFRHAADSAVRARRTCRACGSHRPCGTAFALRAGGPHRACGAAFTLRAGGPHRACGTAFALRAGGSHRACGAGLARPGSHSYGPGGACHRAACCGIAARHGRHGLTARAVPGAGIAVSPIKTHTFSSHLGSMPR